MSLIVHESIFLYLHDLWWTEEELPPFNFVKAFIFLKPMEKNYWYPILLASHRKWHEDFFFSYLPLTFLAKFPHKTPICSSLLVLKL